MTDKDLITTAYNNGIIKGCGICFLGSLSVLVLLLLIQYLQSKKVRYNSIKENIPILNYKREA